MIIGSSHISFRTEGQKVADLLERAQGNMPLAPFIDSKPLKEHSATSLCLRGYDPLPPADVPLEEGVTPKGETPTHREVEVQLREYGSIIKLTNVIVDNHEDPVLDEFTDLCAEQAALTLERMKFGCAKAGTNVFWANGMSRSAVNETISLGVQRLILRSLKGQNAMPFTRVIGSSPDFNTEPVDASYIGLCHTDCQFEVQDLPGFIPVRKYGANTKPYVGEIGAVEEVRYIVSTVFESWPDAGGAKAGSGVEMLSTGGTYADVYPIVYLAKHALIGSAFKGEKAARIYVINPKTASHSNPLGQSGSVGWKTMQGIDIAYEGYIARLETAVRAVPTPA